MVGVTADHGVEGLVDVFGFAVEVLTYGAVAVPACLAIADDDHVVGAERAHQTNRRRRRSMSLPVDALPG
ncbi:hypothetical protein IWC96_14545 [Brevundimonas sp. BAL450]|uniref:hypothetical protein n=1 Tax=Brevundimonas sp. BAL450 TaxID=1708162 RepID=UPI0018C9FF0F|nr:hypothetical protein [Brevundimonas sp. BAL450]MBG7616494.1 hypothetical protein [Brevundimonas sp. BAL450]